MNRTNEADLSAPAFDDPRVVKAMEEFACALDAGAPLDREEFLARHAAIRVALDLCLDGLQFMRAARPQLDDGPADDDPIPAPLGDFRIVRELGRGGMGVIYEAEQISLGRRVALKVLPFASALDQKQIQRFRNEAHAAGQLHHPNIVAVHFVGCERGVHFYAMQYIDGQSLASLMVDLRRPPDDPHTPGAEGDPRSVPTVANTPPNARLSTQWSTHSPGYSKTIARLGAQAALALDHAHDCGVIHRDIKPGNLLLDVRGNLWVTDFGLAYCQGQPGLTMTGDLVGTLRYMSPEQATSKRLPVDLRTDIYSLGASLYELLTLRPVFAANDREELLRQIGLEEPEPPRGLNKSIPAELETIILKALEKKADDRYATAKDLADDLERFLKDEPVLARRPGVRARLAKWTRRHKPLVASLASAGAILAIALFVGALWYAAWSSRVANERLQTNEQIDAAMGDAAALVSQAQAGGRDRFDAWTKAREAAMRAETLAESSLAEPVQRDRVRALRARLDVEERDHAMRDRLEKARMASIPVKAGSYDPNLSMQAYARAFRDYGIDVEKLPVEDAGARLPKRPIRLHLAAALDDWAALTGKMDQRRRLLALARAADQDRWRDQVREVFLRSDLLALRELSDSANVENLPAPTLLLLGRALAAVGDFPAATDLLRRAQPAHAGDYWINELLGLFLLRQQPRAVDEAIPFLRVACALRPDSPDSHNNLGNVLAESGKVDAAIAEYRQALRLQKDHPESHANLGNAFLRKGRLNEAIAEYREAIRLNKDLPGPHANLALALTLQGKLDAAIIVSRRAVELKEDFPEAHTNLATALAQKGRLDEAIAEYRRAIELQNDHAPAHHGLALALERTGERDAAIDEFRLAIQFKKDYAESYFYLGVNLEARRDLDGAITAYRGAVQVNKDFAGAHYNLANLLDGKGDWSGAIAEYREAIRCKPEDAKAYNNLGLVLVRRGDLNGAITCLRQALRHDKDNPGAHNNLGGMLLGKGDVDAALIEIREAIRLKKNYAKAYSNLGVAMMEGGRPTEAIAEYQTAIHLNKEDAEPYYRLANALRLGGNFQAALDTIHRMLELRSADQRWRVAADQMVHQCQRLVELDEQLPGFLEKERKPSSAKEQIELAELCAIRRLPAGAAQFYEDAFKTQRDLLQGHRYNAARAAALAGCGRGKDASRLDAHERERLRAQALRWLHEELAKRVEQPGSLPPSAEKMLRDWQRDQDLVGVRDPDALAKLPATEQNAWRELWTDVAKRLEPR